MARAVIAAVLVLSTAVGCARVSDSRLNPFNWFGGSTESTGLAPDGGFAEIAPDRRNLVDQVTQLRVERTPGGAVIRATGLPPEQGFYDGELVSLTDGEPENGVLEYQFRIRPPLNRNRTSTPQSREVIVGQFLSNQALDGVREIRVVAERNSRAVRR